MSTTQETTTDEREYPYLTERVDGELRTGVAFHPGSGRFFEAVPDDEATAPIDVRCPRTGERKQWDSTLNKIMATAVGGWLFAQCPVEKWETFRDTYANAPDDKHEEWQELWDEITITEE